MKAVSRRLTKIEAFILPKEGETFIAEFPLNYDVNWEEVKILERFPNRICNYNVHCNVILDLSVMD